MPRRCEPKTPPFYEPEAVTIRRGAWSTLRRRQLAESFALVALAAVAVFTVLACTFLCSILVRAM